MTVHEKETHIVRIPVGDLSGDGHDRVKNHDFIVPARFTEDILMENYRKNKELFGFGLKDFAAEYEDFYIPRDKLETLISHGYEYEFNEAVTDRITIGSHHMASFAMFFVGHGLDGFAYEEVPEPEITLFGRWDAPDYGIGYGVFL